jgi:hypothetical protein
MDASPVTDKELISKDASQARHSVADGWLAHGKTLCGNRQALRLVDRLEDRQEVQINSSKIDHVNIRPPISQVDIIARKSETARGGSSFGSDEEVISMA